MPNLEQQATCPKFLTFEYKDLHSVKQDDLPGLFEFESVQLLEWLINRNQFTEFEAIFRQWIVNRDALDEEP